MHSKSIIQSLIAVAIGVGLAFVGSYRGEELGGWKIYGLAVLTAFALNWLAYVPSYLARTEHYYDLTGSLTYQLLAVGILLLTDDRDSRTVILGAMVLIWALRLGSFLFARVKRAGSDGRFDKIKTSWSRFLMAWTVQGLWISFTSAAAFAAMTSGNKKDLGAIGIIGIAIWLLGFGLEVAADNQKSKFKNNPANEGKFISTGLWAVSRHPNYLGETILWIGIALIALPVLQGWQFLTLISPVFVYLLLTRVSGVPLLEHRADKKWGGQTDYEDYKSRTPVFFPRLGSG